MKEGIVPLLEDFVNVGTHTGAVNFTDVGIGIVHPTNVVNDKRAEFSRRFRLNSVVKYVNQCHLHGLHFPRGFRGDRFWCA